MDQISQSKSLERDILATGNPCDENNQQIRSSSSSFQISFDLPENAKYRRLKLIQVRSMKTITMDSM